MAKVSNLKIMKVPKATSTKELAATWSWSKDHLDHFEVEWYNGEGVGHWIEGTKTTTKAYAVNFTASSNAYHVKVKVKPVATKKKSDNKPYWKGEWASYEYALPKNTEVPDTTPAQLPTPTIEVDGQKITASISNVDLKANVETVEFRLYSIDNGTTKWIGTGTVPIKNGRASHVFTATPGGKYTSRCRAVYKGKYGLWSDETGIQTTPPSAPSGWYKYYALSDTSVLLEWMNSPNAEQYEIQYTTKKMYFDSSSDVQSMTVDAITTEDGTKLGHAEVTGLTAGQEYFFRVRAINSGGKSGWSTIVSVIVGKTPSAPTTWSSTTTAIVTEPVSLYWIHNSEDGSSQTYAELELTIDGIVKPVITIKNSTEEKEKDKTSVYKLDTSVYYEGAQIKWRVRTKGVTINNTDGIDVSWSDWSVQRTIDIYAKPTLELVVENQEAVQIETVNSFPFYISAVSSRGRQVPIGYYVTVVSDEFYTTTDVYGRDVNIEKGTALYSKYFNTSDDLKLEMTAGNIDLENGVSYSVKVTVSMDSGLTAEAEVPFNVSWDETSSEPDADITYDKDTYTCSIIPYCRKTPENIFLKSVGWDMGGSVESYEIIDSNSISVIAEDDYAQIWFEIDPNLDATKQYKINCYADNCELYLFKDEELINSDVFDPNTLADVTISGYTLGMFRIKDFNSSNTFSVINMCIFDMNDNDLIEDTLLSVYRKEYDGSFTEIATGIENDAATAVTDPHPSLDYARYRIVATSKSTGAIGYSDVSIPIQEKSLILQWDDVWYDYSYENSDEENLKKEHAWSGSLIRLPYNIDISDKTTPDVNLVEYIGRKRPVSYHGTQLGEVSTWNADIDKNDKDTIYALRRLSTYMGNVYVREPSGIGYWATVNVSMPIKHLDVTIPITLELVRVEGGV